MEDPTKRSVMIAVQEPPVRRTKQKQAPSITKARMVYPPDWFICLLFFGIALCFNLYRLEVPSVWFDEALSIERAQQSLPVLAIIIWTTQANMALYYVVLHFWLQFANLCGWLPTEFVVRFPSAIFAAAAAVVLFLLAKRFLGRRTALLATLLYVLNPLQITYAHETRSYGLQLFLLAIAWYALFAALATDTPRGKAKTWWIVYTIVASLAVYAHLVSLMMLLGQFCAFWVYILFSGQDRVHLRRQIIAYGISLVSLVGFILPLLFASRHGGKTGWMSIPTPKDALSVLMAIGAGNKRYILLLFGFVCFGFIASMLVVFLQRFFAHRVWIKQLGPIGVWRERLPIVLAVVCWCVVPFVASYVISQGPTRLFSSRYMVIVVPPVLLLAAHGVNCLSWKRIHLFLATIMIVLTATITPHYYKSAQVEDWKPVSVWLQQHYQPNDGMICYDNAQGCQLVIEYYLEAYPTGAVFPKDSPGSFPWYRYDMTDTFSANPETAVSLQAVSEYGTKHERIFYIVGRLSSNQKVERAQNAQEWMDNHYLFVDQIKTRTVTIRLYETR